MTHHLLLIVALVSFAAREHVTSSSNLATTESPPSSSPSLPQHTLGPGNSKAYIIGVHATDETHVLILGGEEPEADIDCYFLIRNPHGDGWVIADKDESPKNWCVLKYRSPFDGLDKIMVTNNGKQTTRFTYEVTQ